MIKKNEIKDISGFMKAMSLLCTQPPIFDFAIPKGLKITLSDEIIDNDGYNVMMIVFYFVPDSIFSSV